MRNDRQAAEDPQKSEYHQIKNPAAGSGEAAFKSKYLLHTCSFLYIIPPGQSVLFFFISATRYIHAMHGIFLSAFKYRQLIQRCCHSDRRSAFVHLSGKEMLPASLRKVERPFSLICI